MEFNSGFKGLKDNLRAWEMGGGENLADVGWINHLGVKMSTAYMKARQPEYFPGSQYPLG